MFRHGTLVAAVLFTAVACTSPGSVEAHQTRPPKPSTSTAAAPIPVVVIGDSYTGGSGVGGVGAHGWPALIWARLDASGVRVAPRVGALGGSGFVHRGQTGVTLAEEVPKVVGPDVRLVVFFGGTNDVGLPVDAVGAAALGAFQDARRIAPGARLLVVGPMSPHPGRSVVLLATRDAIRDAAVAVGADWVDPVDEAWFADTPELIGADRVHPTDAGHVYLADRIEPHVRDELGRMKP